MIFTYIFISIILSRIYSSLKSVSSNKFGIATIQHYLLLLQIIMVTLPPGAFISIVEVWTDYVREEHENKAIKKTLTIPKWLNDAAEKESINFSQLLQFAIKERLGIVNKQ